MTGADIPFVPVVNRGVLRLAPGPADSGPVPDIRSETDIALRPTEGRPGLYLLDPVPEADFSLSLQQGDGAQVDLAIQVGGWSGRVEWIHGGLISGWARNLRAPNRDQMVVAFTGDGVVAHACARADNGGRFLMVLPAHVARPMGRVTLRLGIAGSDYLLEHGRVSLGQGSGLVSRAIRATPVDQLAIRLKISTPNLEEAPLWGDFHFATSLAAAFSRIGHQADVDTADAWYAHGEHEDVVIKIRGRHRLKVDPSKINIMWLISHPDRIPDEEYADYDHIAVASDIYADVLRARGLPSVSVLHQATDAALFAAVEQTERARRCLFVGNSRREFRTMVKWCLERDLPLDLYGGGWDGLVPPEILRAPAISNTDLPGFYAAHLILLNDHWDSMRDNGFLSNRLFDGSATATPIITDAVAGLADIFGDAIPAADDLDTFAQLVHDCLDDPAPFLERAQRARDIVLSAHTFDHRARELSTLIDAIAARRHRLA